MTKISVCGIVITYVDRIMNNYTQKQIEVEAEQFKRSVKHIQLVLEKLGISPLVSQNQAKHLVRSNKQIETARPLSDL